MGDSRQPPITTNTVGNVQTKYQPAGGGGAAINAAEQHSDGNQIEFIMKIKA